MPKQKKSRFTVGQNIKFFQTHMRRRLPFTGKIHAIVCIDGSLVLHVEVSHSDGSLWALVRESAAILLESGDV